MGPVARFGEADLVRRSVGSNGRRISYLAAGDARLGAGQIVLLIHGSGVSARSWTEQLRDLSQARWVLAIDLPGHGESDPIPDATVERYAEACRCLLGALRTGPVFVAGHSLGGAVAMALAARSAELVKGLVLLSTCAKFPETEGSLGGLLWSLPGPIRRLLFFSLAKKVLFAPGAPGRAVRLGMEEVRSCRPETILKDVAVAKAMDLEDAAKALRLPTLILCGNRDKLTPPALSQQLHQLILGSRLEILEGVGHMLPLEAPERLHQALLAFVESVTRSEVARLPRIGGGTKRSVLRCLLDRGKALWKRSAIGD